ncbi:MAG TPA: type II toxin-antitoxin system mRNA interferase toxin, RelE/StbE family [Candidatus Pacebacteria bacterium]|nr:type II toxin-antitoxin system mRNA interferase toxin, RelE/StbE family [Candidatus Paceibacterota bacterium]
MRVIISPRAEKQLKKLPKFDQLAVVEVIRSLIIGLDHQAQKLSGFADIYRIRIGHYRLVYRHQTQEIYVILLAHRREVYQDLKLLLK